MKLTKASALVDYFRWCGTTPQLRAGTSASVVHHMDYLNRRDDHALCGVALENPTTLGQTGPSDTVCTDCEGKLVEYHLTWWRNTARAATTELDELRVKYREQRRTPITSVVNSRRCSLLRRSRRTCPVSLLRAAGSLKWSRRATRPRIKPEQRRHPSSTMREGNSWKSVGDAMKLSPTGV